MSNFTFQSIFNSLIGNTGVPAKSNKRKKSNRTCRFEELEGREMLSVTPWTLADDVFYTITEPQSLDCVACSAQSEDCGSVSLSPLGATPADAHADDLAVYNDLIARGCEDDDFTWNAEGRITEIDMEIGGWGRGLTGTLDVSALTALEYLNCGSNNLTELNVAGLTNLVELRFGGNNLTEVNVTGLTNLELLDCDWNNLTELKVTGLTNLKWLLCESNHLTELDATGLTNLERLRCEDNNLTKLDVTGLTNLVTLGCSSNNLTKLDVTGLTNLEGLICSSNNLTELNVAGLTKLVTLGCSSNNLTELNLFGTPYADFASKEPRVINGVCYYYMPGPGENELYVDETVTLRNEYVAPTDPTTKPAGTDAKPVKVSGIKKTNISLSQVTISWKANVKNTFYEVKCTSHPDIHIGSVEMNNGKPTITITGLNPKTTYKFEIISYNGDNPATKNGKITSVAKVSVKTKAYAALKVTKKTATSESITLIWKNSPFVETTHYQIRDAVTGEVLATLPTEETFGKYTGIVDGLLPSTKYKFEIVAVSDMLDGLESKVKKVSAKTKK